jgi:hypothetical protein
MRVAHAVPPLTDESDTRHRPDGFSVVDFRGDRDGSTLGPPRRYFAPRARLRSWWSLRCPRLQGSARTGHRAAQARHLRRSAEREPYRSPRRPLRQGRWPCSRSRSPQGCVASSRWARVGVEPLSGRDYWPQGQLQQTLLLCTRLAGARDQITNTITTITTTTATTAIASVRVSMVSPSGRGLATLLRFASRFANPS